MIYKFLRGSDSFYCFHHFFILLFLQGEALNPSFGKYSYQSVFFFFFE